MAIDGTRSWRADNVRGDVHAGDVTESGAAGSVWVREVIKESGASLCEVREEPVMVSPPVQTLYEGMAKVEKLLDRLDLLSGNE